MMALFDEKGPPEDIEKLGSANAYVMMERVNSLIERVNNLQRSKPLVGWPFDELKDLADTANKFLSELMAAGRIDITVTPSKELVVQIPSFTFAVKLPTDVVK